MGVWIKIAIGNVCRPASFRCILRNVRGLKCYNLPHFKLSHLVLDVWIRTYEWGDLPEERESYLT